MMNLEKLETIVGKDHVVSGDDRQPFAENSLGSTRNILAVVRPKITDEIQQIVEWANQENIPLYPFSTGKNTGYGDMLPVTENNVLVDLSRMNQIIEFNTDQNYILIEPGVTQKQLFEHVNGTPFMVDVTGAGPDASYIGNSLDGGFGHTPLGNRRMHITGLEAVLGTGEIISTGDQFDLGPQTSGLFVQSNFGIVTKMKIPIVKKPEFYMSYFLSTDNEHFPSLIENVRELREQGHMPSLIHIANATRYVLTTRAVPESFKDTLMTPEDAVSILKNPLIKMNYWDGVGGLYGSKSRVLDDKEQIKRKLKGIAEVSFFTDQFLSRSKKIADFFNGIPLAKMAHDQISIYDIMHGFMKGIPTDVASKNIRWRAPTSEDAGVMWYAPTTAATVKNIHKLIEIGQTTYGKFNFEMPLTLTFVKPEQAIGVLSIHYTKTNQQEKERAFQLYHELHSAYVKEGILPYRMGILGMPHITHTTEKERLLTKLKNAFDPNNIIAPGRYNLS